MSATQSDRAPHNDSREKKHDESNVSHRVVPKSTQMTLRDAAFLLAGYFGGYAAAADKEEQ